MVQGSSGKVLESMDGHSRKEALLGDDGDTEVLGPQSVIIKAGGRKQKIVPPHPKMTVAELGKATALSVAHRVWQQTRQDN